MSLFAETVMPILQKFLIYFAGSGALGLITAFIVIKIMPKPKRRDIREELNVLIAKIITAAFLAAGIYLFADSI